MLPQLLLLFQLGTTLMNYVGQRNLAIAQQRNINAAYADSVAQTDEQIGQINADASEKQSERARQALIERARLRAAAGESGLAGVSTDRVVDEASMAGSRDKVRIEADRKDRVRSAEWELQGLTSRARSDMAQVRYPSLLGAGLQIATDYAGYRKNIDK